MSTGPTPKTAIQVVPTFRMTPEMYAQMEADLPTPTASREDTDITAGQKLGVQLALRYIRQHFLVS